MTRRKNDPLPSTVDRRQLLQFGACLVFTTTACNKSLPLLTSIVGTDTSPDVAGATGTITAPGPAAAPWSPPPPDPGVLAGIDTIVVLMMENRSFDHVFGLLGSDKAYPAASSVECLHGGESNIAADGKVVSSYPLESPVQTDPQHSWAAAHAQWNHGKNDGFMRGNAAKAAEVMGYYSREHLPMTYWLADNFTLCDHWHAAVLGPTWPNRAVLHATTAAGIKSNVPFVTAPQTIWDGLAAVNRDAKNYYAGSTSTYAGLFADKIRHGVNPTAPIDEFFTAASDGTLPAFSMIDPDYETNDDHPSHSTHLGQVLISSIYHALAASPQWNRCLFIITYDEHGGFYDHVAPPPCNDADPLYAQLGFRVPALVIGPTVKRGVVCDTVFEHSSVAATLRTCFGIASLTERMAASNDLSVCIDPAAISAPRPPPANPPVLQVPALALLLQEPPAHAQEELAAMMESGQIPSQAMDKRSRSERVKAWLQAAHALGAIHLPE